MKNSFQKSDKYRHRIDNIIVGREKETQIIKNEYNKLLQGQMGIVSVVGVPGVGKTFLLDCAFKQIRRKTLVNIKFKQNTERAFNSIAVLMEEIIEHLLMLPREALDEIVLKVNKSITNDIGLLTSICPKISKLVLTERPHIVTDYDRYKYRIKNAIFNLIDISSDYLYPLIIHIDDIQWADQLSFDVVRTLINKKQTLKIMLALSYRDYKNMDKISEILKARSSFIELKPLNQSHIKEYLSVFLNGEVEYIDELTTLIYGFSLGNPFYIKETIIKLIEDSVVRYSRLIEKWEITINKINHFILNNNIEKIVRDNIFKQNSDVLLKLIYCFDGKVDYNILKLLYDTDEIVLKSHLKKLIESSVIVKYKEKDGHIIILFTHDIISKLVDSCMTVEQKQNIHYQIADKLLNTEIEIKNRDLFIVSHLVRASRELINRQADKWIELLFNVGIQEKQKASLDAALMMFEFCNDILPYTTIKNQSLTVNIQLELAECLCLVKRYEESRDIIQRLVDCQYDKTIMLEIKIKQLYLYHYQREHRKTIVVGKQILKYLGFGFGKHRLPVDLIVCKFVYSRKKIENLANATGMDKKVSTAIDTLIIMNTSATASDDSQTAAIGLSAALISANYGKSPALLIGYVLYAYVLYTIWKDFKKTKMLVEQIIKITETTYDNLHKSTVYFLIGTFLSHWYKPIGKAEHYLQKSIEYGNLTGDFIFLGYSISMNLDTKFFMGINQDILLKYIDGCRTVCAETEQYTTAYNLDAYTDHIMALKHGCDDFDFERTAKRYPKLTPFEKLTEKMLLLERLLLLDKLELGYKLVLDSIPHIKTIKGLISEISVVFYSALIRIGVHDQLGKAQQINNKIQINRILNKLKCLTGLQKDNFYSYYILATAEYETYIKNRPSNLYDEAADHAKRQGNLSIEALAYQLAAKRYSHNKKLSRFYASLSERLHRLRGADYVAKIIEKKYDLAEESSTEDETGEPNNGEKSESLLHTYIRQSQGLSEENKTTLLIRTIIEAGFADRCCIMLEKSRQLYLKNQMDRLGTVRNYTEPVNIKNLENLPRKVIRYAARTQEEVIIADRQHQYLFENDAYVAENPDISIACIPMINCNVTIGVLYLEKHEAPISQEAIFEIKTILPLLVTSFSAIKDVVIKDLFVPTKRSMVLSNRETDIIKLLAQGLSNEQMCEKLNLSIGTVKKHMSSIMTKLDAENRTMALTKAREMNIL